MTLQTRTDGIRGAPTCVTSCITGMYTDTTTTHGVSDASTIGGGTG